MAGKKFVAFFWWFSWGTERTSLRFMTRKTRVENLYEDGVDTTLMAYRRGDCWKSPKICCCCCWLLKKDQRISCQPQETPHIISHQHSSVVPERNETSSCHPLMVYINWIWWLCHQSLEHHDDERTTDSDNVTHTVRHIHRQDCARRINVPHIPPASSSSSLYNMAIITWE